MGESVVINNIIIDIIFVFEFFIVISVSVSNLIRRFLLKLLSKHNESKIINMDCLVLLKVRIGDLGSWFGCFLNNRGVLMLKLSKFLSDRNSLLLSNLVGIDHTKQGQYN